MGWVCCVYKICLFNIRKFYDYFKATKKYLLQTFGSKESWSLIIIGFFLPEPDFDEWPELGFDEAEEEFERLVALWLSGNADT